MKIVFGNDHTGVALKKELMSYVSSLGHEVIDVGTNQEDSSDYPIYGEKVANMVVGKQADLGMLVCGTGVGISLAANKVKGIRAVVCSEPYSAKLSRMHNDTNILALGARVVGPELAKMIAKEWLEATFEGGRHQRRIDMISDIETQK